MKTFVSWAQHVKDRAYLSFFTDFLKFQAGIHFFSGLQFLSCWLNGNTAILFPAIFTVKTFKYRNNFKYWDR